MEDGANIVLSPCRLGAMADHRGGQGEGSSWTGRMSVRIGL